MSASHGGLAQSVQVRLVRHAKEIGVDPQLVLTRYAVERFLYRLSRSPYAEQFVLKGALLLLVWLGEALRPTRDADLLGFGDLNDDVLVRMFRALCGLDVEPDGLSFLAETVDVQPIREEDAYGGQRVIVQARLGPARLSVQVDIGLGDAITPSPQWLEYPSLLDSPRPRLRAYSRETVVAEKFHAMVVLGLRNSRLKDYFDIHALLREGALEANQLARAIASTFDRRRTEVPQRIPEGLSDAFASETAHQARWRAFLARNRVDGPALDVVVAAIRDGLAPAIEQARALTPPPSTHS